MRVESWAETHIGLVRTSNQDSIGCFEEARLFVVADGMGGHSGGDIASRLAVEAIRAALQPAVGSVPAGLLSSLRQLLGSGGPAPAPRSEAAVRTALEVANQRILEAGKQDASMSRDRPMGTTAVVLLLGLDEQRAYWAHLGDSRLYRLRNRTLRLLTADHTGFGSPYRDGKAVPVDLPHTNQLEQALGPQAEIEVRSGSDQLEGGDCFMLCSDGVSGLLDAPFMENVLASATSLAAAGTQLLQAALAAGGKDNASLILIRCVPD